MFGRLTKKVSTVIATALLATLAGSANAAEYKIDLSHSFIQFRISHLGYSVMVGRFNDFEGTVSWDKDNAADSAIELSIKTASIDSNWAERDKHLRGDDFLDVEKFPQASFKSTKYDGDANGGSLEGDLTLHGVTKPISLQLTYVGEGPDPWDGYRAGFSATTTIDRTDFGIDYELGPTSNTMEFDLFIEAIRQ